MSRPGRRHARQERTFLDAFAAECPVEAEDVIAIPTFRKLTLAIYAKFMATRRAASQLGPELDDAFDRTLAELEDD